MKRYIYAGVAATTAQAQEEEPLAENMEMKKDMKTMEEDNFPMYDIMDPWKDIKEWDMDKQFSTNFEAFGDVATKVKSHGSWSYYVKTTIAQGDTNFFNESWKLTMDFVASDLSAKLKFGMGMPDFFWDEFILKFTAFKWTPLSWSLWFPRNPEYIFNLFHRVRAQPGNADLNAMKICSGLTTSAQRFKAEGLNKFHAPECTVGLLSMFMENQKGHSETLDDMKKDKMDTDSFEEGEEATEEEQADSEEMTEDMKEGEESDDDEKELMSFWKKFMGNQDMMPEASCEMKDNVYFPSTTLYFPSADYIDLSVEKINSVSSAALTETAWCTPDLFNWRIQDNTTPLFWYFNYFTYDTSNKFGKAPVSWATEWNSKLPRWQSYSAQADWWPQFGSL